MAGGGRTGEGVAGAVWGALGLACAALLLGFPLGRDHQIFALVADGVLAGGVPYADVWDYKPPGIYAVFVAARALSASPVALRGLELLAVGSLVPAFAVLSERFVGDRRAGVLGALVSLVTYTSFGFWHTGQPEGFAGVVIAWAMVLVSGGPGLGRWVAVGAACAVAAAFKPTCALPGLVFAGWAAERHPEQALDALVAHAAGLIGATVLGLLGFWWLGALPDLLDAVGFAGEHARQSYLDDGPVDHLRRAAVGLVALAPFATLGLVPLAVLRPVHAEERWGAWLAVGVVAASVVGVAMQGRFFLYHQASAVLLVGLPAGLGWWKAGLALPDRLRAPAGVGAAALLLATLSPSGWTAVVASVEGRELDEGRSHRRLAAFNQETIDEVGVYLDEHVPPGPIFVWGLEPGLYRSSGRAPASRYVTDEPQRTFWSAEARRADLMAELQRTPPAAIVVEHGDVVPFLMASGDDSAEALEGFGDLRRLLRRSYDPLPPVGDFDLYVRKAAAPSSATPNSPSQPSSSGAR